MIYRIWRLAMGMAAAIGMAFSAMVPVVAENNAVIIGVGDTVLTVNGRTSPSAFVTILDDGTVIGTATADSVGDFSHTFTAFAPDVHQISVYASDAQGRTTSPVSKEVNVAEHAVTTVDFFLPTTLTIDTSTVRTGTPIQLQGSTIPNGNVVILVDDATRATITADPAGNWQYVLETTAMTAGNHTVYVIVSDPGTAEQSYPTTKAQLTLIAPEDVPPPIIAPPIPTITFPVGGSTITDTSLTVRGTAQPGTRVELFDGSAIVGSTFASSNGEWEINISLSNPSYSLYARACRLLACSDFSQVVNFFWQSPGQLGSGLAIRLERYWFFIPQNSSITHNIHISGGNVPYALRVDWGDGSSDQLSTKDTLLTLAHTYKKAGRFNGTVVVTDKNGAEAKQTFAIEVIATPAASWWIISAIGLVFILILSIFAYRQHVRKRQHANE